jgi:hypothetical protein
MLMKLPLRTRPKAIVSSATTLSSFSLDQFADGSLLLRTACEPDVERSAIASLQALFGPGVTIRAEQATDAAWNGKPIHYTSDLEFNAGPPNR